MQISLKWVEELIDINSITLDNLIDKLTLGGFEVEEIIQLEIDNKNSIALDISATANRSDSLSIQGLSSEIAALLNQDIKTQRYSNDLTAWKSNLVHYSKPVAESDHLTTSISLIIKGLTDFQSPKWLQQKLISSGIEPENSLLDFQNYILLETGYPIAFYDFEKICSKLETTNFQLQFLKAENDQKFIASNQVTYNLSSSIDLLKANNIPLSIAGIIEHEDYITTNSTTSLLIEGSIFNAAKIRQQSRILGLRTDRSARYEKSLNSTYLLEAIYRLMMLLRIKNPNLICELHTVFQSPEKKIDPILLNYNTIQQILGPILENKKITSIERTTVEQYLTRLNFDFTYDQLNLTWNILVPDSRTEDIVREIDVIEEIGRLHGFNNFLTILPKIKVIGNEDKSYKIRKKLTTCLLNLGFTELINYSLVAENTFMKNEVKLVNPLLADCSNLRSSLLPTLVKTVQENLKQGNCFIEGFEYGHVFSFNNENKFQENEKIAGIFGGITKKLTWSTNNQPLTWFEAKGKIEKLFKQLNIETSWTVDLFKNNQLLHPYRSAQILTKTGEIIGLFGQIHPIIANNCGIPNHTYLFEFNFHVIVDQLQNNKLSVYKEYSLYPKIIKDLSFIIKDSVSFQELQQIIYLNGTKFLAEINLLDEYKGPSIPNQHTSLCIQLIFQSNEKTLETKKIETIIQNLNSILTQKFDILVRN